MTVPKTKPPGGRVAALPDDPVERIDQCNEIIRSHTEVIASALEQIRKVPK
jgi:hypothetical protein